MSFSFSTKQGCKGPINDAGTYVSPNIIEYYTTKYVCIDKLHLSHINPIEDNEKWPAYDHWHV